MGETSNCDGVLELELGKKWRPALERDRRKHYDMESAHVVCRQLGCGHALRSNERYGSEYQDVWFTRSSCKGSETRAKDCIYHSGNSKSMELRVIKCSGNKQ